MKLQSSTDLLLTQWQAAPKFSALIKHLIAGWQTGAGALTAADQPDKTATDLAPGEGDLERMLHVDTAEGLWLDRIAARLGLLRPSVETSSAQDTFGFRDANAATQPTDPDTAPFDAAPFKGALGDIARVPLNDTEFRAMVRARGVAVTSRGDLRSFVKAVKYIDPGAEVEDKRNMTIVIRTNQRTQLERADKFGALPRSAGVRIEYDTPQGFGMDKAGGAFDTTPFKDN